MEEMTKSDLIWEAIKNLPIDMYSLPNQRVSDHVTRVEVSNEQVHVRLKSTSVIASLERALPKKYKMEEGSEYVIISELTEAEKNTSEKIKQRSVVVEVTDE